MNDLKKSQRLESLDALRGFDMLFIMGGSGLLAALAICFPDIPFFEALKEQMGHVSWHGLRHHDTIFPLFLFIAGISFPFSLEKQRLSHKSTTDIYLKILRRGLMLVFLGLVYNGLLNFDFAHLRYCSVLSRIGIAWMCAALIFVTINKNLRRVAIVVALLVGYWLLIGFVKAPDAADGADIFSKEGSLACYIDRIVLGAHSYQAIYDPEGLLSNIPAIATALMGMLTGEWVKMKRDGLSETKKVVAMLLVGVALILLGILWGCVFPINKSLWTSSFLCVVGGYSLLIFALFYYIIDVKGWKKWDIFFTVIGLNSITIYLAQRFIDFNYTANRLFGGFVALFPEQYHPLLGWSAYILVCWLFLYVLYRKKIFLKV